MHAFSRFLLRNRGFFLFLLGMLMFRSALADWNTVRDDVFARYRSGPKARFREPFAETAARIAHARGIAALADLTRADIRGAR